MILAYCYQDISFIVATVALRTPVVGWFCKKMRCIAVERPQDLAKNGTGKIVVRSSCVIQGVGTQFKKEILVGDTLKFVGSSVIKL
jgi:glycerol-3-phosphate O-acyltransferase/dihydroxyacetone phosphate acyltransferase